MNIADPYLQIQFRLCCDENGPHQNVFLAEAVSSKREENFYPYGIRQGLSSEFRKISDISYRSTAGKGINLRRDFDIVVLDGPDGLKIKQVTKQDIVIVAQYTSKNRESWNDAFKENPPHIIATISDNNMPDEERMIPYYEQIAQHANGKTFTLSRRL